MKRLISLMIVSVMLFTNFSFRIFASDIEQPDSEEITVNNITTKDDIKKYFNRGKYTGDNKQNPHETSVNDEEDGTIWLTKKDGSSDDAKNIIGRAIINSAIDFSKDFEFKANVNIGNKDFSTNPKGADGISFIFTSDHENLKALEDENGRYISSKSTAGAMGMGGLEYAFGFKLDTYWNSVDESAFSAAEPEIGKQGTVGAFVLNGERPSASSHDYPITYYNDQDSSDNANPKLLNARQSEEDFKLFDLKYDATSKTLTAKYDDQEWSLNVGEQMNNQGGKQIYFGIYASTKDRANLYIPFGLKNVSMKFTRYNIIPVDNDKNDQIKTPDGYHRVNIKIADGEDIEYVDNDGEKFYDVLDGKVVIPSKYPNVKVKNKTDDDKIIVWSVKPNTPITKDYLGDDTIVAKLMKADANEITTKVNNDPTDEMIKGAIKLPDEYNGKISRISVNTKAKVDVVGKTSVNVTVILYDGQTFVIDVPVNVIDEEKPSYGYFYEDDYDWSKNDSKKIEEEYKPTVDDMKHDYGNKKLVKEHKAYIFGYVDGTVKPLGNLKRSEAAAMVARLMEYDLSNTNKPNFTDTDGWYNGSINAVVRAGLMKGYLDGTFRPDASITRSEFVQLIKNIDKQNTASIPFTDVSENHWAYDAIVQAYANGRVEGFVDGTFKPEQFITRAEVAKILNSLFDRHVDERGLNGLNDSLKYFTDLIKGEWYYYDMVEATNTHEYVMEEDYIRKENLTFELWQVTK